MCGGGWVGGCLCVCVCASKEGGCTPNKANQLMCSGTTPRGKLRAKATSHSPSSLNHRPSGQSYSPKQHKTQWVCTHIVLISHAAPSTSHVSVAVATYHHWPAFCAVHTSYILPRTRDRSGANLGKCAASFAA